MKMFGNHKGFSLIELIVVVAIMAVLVAVLAPTLMRYVEKTRKQKDESAASEVRNAVELALAELEVYNSVADGGQVVVTDNTEFSYIPAESEDGAALLNELNATIPGGKLDFDSRAHDGDTYTVTITLRTDVIAVIEVNGAFVEE